MDDIANQIRMIEDKEGSRIWFLNDQLHRTDGPAIEHASGLRFWYLNNRQYKFDEWAKALGIYDTDEFVMMRLTYG